MSTDSGTALPIDPSDIPVVEVLDVTPQPEPALEAAVEEALLEADVRAMAVTFYFDPSCPWSWRASRWLVAVAPSRHLEIEWAACSLALLHEGDVEPRDDAKRQSALHALRIIEALRADGRHETAGRFYAVIGSATFEDHRDLDDDLVRKAAHVADADDAITAIDDPAWDNAVRAAHDTAMAAAGPGVGSPVICIGGVERGLSGPILDAVPTGGDAEAMWDAVAALIRAPEFFEVKRGRP